MTKKYCSIPIAVFALFSFISIAAGNVLLGIATLCFLIYVFRNKQELQVNDKIYYIAIAVFLLTMLISALTSGAIGKGLKVWADFWIWRLMPFVMVTLAVKEVCKAKKILACSLLGITLGAICLIYQGFSGDHRASGFFGHPMTFAGYFCIYLPVLLVCFLEQQVSGKWRYLAGCSFVLSTVALLFNATRGAWLALMPVLLFILLYYLLKRNKLAMLCLALFILAGAGLSQYKPFTDRLATITNTKYQSNTERLLIWNSAYTMFKDHPVLGVGLGQYKDNYQKKYISPKAKEPYLSHAHNNFLQMLAENGVVGFVGFLTLITCFIGYSFKRFWQERNPYALMMSMSTLALVLQGFTEYNFGNSAVMKSFWLVQGCLLVMSTNGKK